MNATTQKVCVWCGVAMVVVWVFGFWIFAGFVPPPSPNKNAEQIADVFRGHTNLIRFGLLLSVFGSPLLMPFFSTLSVQMKRIEGQHAPLSYLQLTLGAMLVLEFLFPLMILQGAAFRPERSPEAIQTIDDIAWLLFLGLVTTGVLQFIVVGAAILQDQRPDPIFPRWAGYYNFWAGLIFAPGGLCVFFKSGPFAWDGLFVWWIPLGNFSIWIAIMTVLLLKAINRQAQEAPDKAIHHDLDIDRKLELLNAEIAALRVELATKAR